MIEIALYQPEIPQNTGTILRTGACLGFKVHIIEPTGFLWSVAAFRRAGMDYLDQVEIVRHNSYEQFLAANKESRLILATTKTEVAYTEFSFQSGDIVLFGQESAGVPKRVTEDTSHHITIPVRKQARSLNLAVSVAMIAGEAMRQL